MIVSIIINLILSLAHVTNWLFFFYWLSYIKLAITLIKYCPQVIIPEFSWNFRKKLMFLLGFYEL